MVLPSVCVGERENIGLEMPWGHPRNLKIYAPPKLDVIFFNSPRFPETRREGHVFFETMWKRLGKILSREDQCIYIHIISICLYVELYNQQHDIFSLVDDVCHG